MKRLIKNFLRYFGYNIHRINKDVHKINIYNNAPSYPYIEEFKMGNIKFRYWVTDDIYKSWYNPFNQAKWCVNEGYLKFIRKSDKILEVGCSNGFTTCLLKSAIEKNALVVAMDVIPPNCLIANAQVGLNSFINCHILNLGAADFNGKIRVANINNGFVELRRTENTIEVDAIMCDGLIKKHGFFDVLKVDVEGFETNVFKGCLELLSKKPKLLVELHGSELKNYGSDYNELFQIIRAHEYEGYMYLNPNSPHATNKLEEFNLDWLVQNQVHANIFLKPRNP